MPRRLDYFADDQAVSTELENRASDVYLEPHPVEHVYCPYCRSRNVRNANRSVVLAYIKENGVCDYCMGYLIKRELRFTKDRAVAEAKAKAATVEYLRP
jgi:hypothetical protein